MQVQARNAAALKREPRLQTSMLRGWQHLMRSSPGFRLYCDVPTDWLLRSSRNDADRSHAGPPRLQQVDFVLCNRMNAPLVVVHLIDGPGLKHRREPQAVRMVNRTLRRLSDAGIRIWVWDAHALPPLDVLRRQVLRLRVPGGAGREPDMAFRASVGSATCGWVETQVHRLHSMLCGLLVGKKAARPTPHRRTQENPRPVNEAMGVEWRRLAPVLHGLDESVLCDMLGALARLLDRVPAARHVLRHVGALEWGLKRLRGHAFLKLPLSVLSSAEVQLGELVDGGGDVRAIRALQARLRSAVAWRNALPVADGRARVDDALEVTNIEVREIRMSTFLEVDSTWRGHLRQQGQLDSAHPRAR